MVTFNFKEPIIRIDLINKFLDMSLCSSFEDESKKLANIKQY